LSTYQALYRAWRPQNFKDLIGQPHVKQTLTNALSRNQVAHAYLFSGPRGTGKTSTAKVLAKAINCEHPDGVEPCNTCEACQSITAGSNVDVEEIDAASNRGVDEIRQLRETVQYAPARLRRKVYIVDEVHMLTTEAFNALLKTLEEPPSHALFVLATTEPHKIPGTIVSRCQRFDFRRIAPETIREHLERICDEEGWSWEEEALWKIAEAADGGLRDALGLLEQTAAFGQGKVSAESAAHVLGGVESSLLIRLVRSIVDNELLDAIQLLMQWYAAGKDPGRILQEILQLIRDLFIVKLSMQKGTSMQTYSPLFLDAAKSCSEAWLLHALKVLGETYSQLRYVDQPRLALEAALLGLAAPKYTAMTGVETTANAGGQPATLQEGTVKPNAASAGDDRARPAGAKPLLSPKAAAERKMAVLKELSEQQDEQMLQRIKAAWAQILQYVRGQRIQTHAWLMNGEPILATSDVVILSFSSRLHRDAVMKADERTVIEEALRRVIGLPIRMMALLKSDWDAFIESLSKKEPSTERVNWVERVVDMFGEELVEIQETE
jgi:DNA polymerase-3 subunit gamma/tau